MASPAPGSIDDSLTARIPSTCPPATAEILHAAWAHDAPKTGELLDEPGKARAQEPTTGETPLHATVRACGLAPTDPAELEKAKATLSELLLWGGIWNDVDEHNETPGCLALRLGQSELYNLCVEAGVRAEMLFGLLEGYEELGSDAEEEEEEEEEVEVEVEVVDETGVAGEAQAQEDDGAAPDLAAARQLAKEFGVDMIGGAEGAGVGAVDIEEPTFVPPQPADADTEIKSEEYLRSKLTYSDGKLVDDVGNGVMMAWETEIMRKSVDALVPNQAPGRRILNIGFGMGIIDSMFAETKPVKHHIIEAHEEVLSHLDSAASTFGKKWEESGPEEGAFKVHRGRWQDTVPKLLEHGEVYDAIYFDTFGEDYSQLRKFFTECIPSLMDRAGIFSFFNGLGADRQICYDVYTKVVEFHMIDAGMDVDWEEINVNLKGLEEAGKGEWEGVKRRYWTLDKYRLPVCTFLG
ncbi:unnamed protein product [Discula destructiva]